jgi:hypothetical protein
LDSKESSLNDVSLEVCFYYKRLPGRTLVAPNKTEASGASKNSQKITVAVCCNVSGKLSPLQNNSYRSMALDKLQKVIFLLDNDPSIDESLILSLKTNYDHLKAIVAD